MNRKWYIWLVLLSLSVLSACSSYRYYKAGDSFISLNKYKTFAWAQNLPNRKPDSIVNDQKGLGARLNYLNNNRYFKSPEAARTIKTATVTILQSKGLTLQESNADLLVRYTTLVDRGTRNAYYGGYPYYGGFYGGWGWGWRRPWFGYGGWGGYGYGYGYPVKEHFKEGVLAIELIDSRTRETVWIGYGAGELSRNPEKVIAQLPKVVDGIFKQLPVSH
ncbi:DUF4136 domain-containing protein [Mucilaginibacter sp. Bleaf8]|uniref:DUF4136 domain-containing protein n=1 Tax=Mucilaginibacter sp. Bleaf8 TaxID=2834430 RepID=UPI001BCFEF20|nr:DUF4136 domain-containing protein [Mucilaginibacter sp. Bleaf8]MBS7564304.1 DUF4136 domain-containing protein [Mucilaginibacter sp. Bleaf8]